MMGDLEGGCEGWAGIVRYEISGIYYLGRGCVPSDHSACQLNDWCPWIEEMKNFSSITAFVDVLPNEPSTDTCAMNTFVITSIAFARSKPPRLHRFSMEPTAFMIYLQTQTSGPALMTSRVASSEYFLKF